MHILHEKYWRGDYLDYCRRPGQYRVRVRLWHVLAPVDQIHVSPPKNWRTIFNYLGTVGIRKVTIKTISRLRERLRNKKFISCGIGQICEQGAWDRSLPKGQAVVFLAPCHPRCIERISLHKAFLAPLTSRTFDALPDDSILFFDGSDDRSDLRNNWAQYVGWSDFSGFEVKGEELKKMLAGLESRLLELDLSKAKRLPVQPDSTAVEFTARKTAGAEKRLKAVIFGYGQHAKTNVIVNLHQGIELVKVHEIDPCQIKSMNSFPYGCDSSPEPRPDERFDVYLIAGYHHTHTPLAVTALAQGSAAVVEKPLASDSAQLDGLLNAIRETKKGRFFAGFHKRYSLFNQFAFKDLGVESGEPISYQCVVYEPRVPFRHWYNWPNSGSGMFANGCHWIDHFLFLNDFADVDRYELWESGKGNVSTLVELSNGATFTMAYTEEGSCRVGVREHVVLSAGDATVRIDDWSRYVAEDSRRIVRRCRRNRMESFGAMYKDIFGRIVHQGAGDTLRSVQVSSRLVLALEDRLQSLRREAGKTVARP